MSAPTQRVLAVIPPMTQLNTPYPSTAYLTGFLRSRGIAAVQEDLALALVLELFSPPGLQAVRDCVDALHVDDSLLAACGLSSPVGPPASVLHADTIHVKLGLPQPV